MQASYCSYKVVNIAEKAFKLNANNTNRKCTNTCNLVQKMSIDVVSSSNWNTYFPSTDYCFQFSVGFEDDHVKQIVKHIFHKYLTMHLHTYGKLYTREVINKKILRSTHYPMSLSCLKTSS